MPGNTAILEFARERFEPGAWQHAFEDPAEGSAQSYFDLGNAQQVSCAMAHPLQIHVVHADYLAAMNVDDLAVDEVLLQVEIVALILQRNEGA